MVYLLGVFILNHREFFLLRTLRSQVTEMDNVYCTEKLIQANQATNMKASNWSEASNRGNVNLSYSRNIKLLTISDEDSITFFTGFMLKGILNMCIWLLQVEKTKPSNVPVKQIHFFKNFAWFSKKNTQK